MVSHFWVTAVIVFVAGREAPFRCCVFDSYQMIPRSLRPASCAKPFSPPSNMSDSFLGFVAGGTNGRLHRTDCDVRWVVGDTYVQPTTDF